MTKVLTFRAVVLRRRQCCRIIDWEGDARFPSERTLSSEKDARSRESQSSGDDAGGAQR